MNDELFRGMKPASAPAGLRDRALRAARAAAREGCEAQQPRWGFTRFDLVWVAALLVLVVVNGMFSISSGQRTVASSRRPAHDVPEKPMAGPEASRELLALGLNLEAAPRQRREPPLSLEQALRAGS
jgi:hypothetical protein